MQFHQSAAFKLNTTHEFVVFSFHVPQMIRRADSSTEIENYAEKVVDTLLAYVKGVVPYQIHRQAHYHLDSSKYCIKEHL